MDTRSTKLFYDGRKIVEILQDLHESQLWTRMPECLSAVLHDQRVSNLLHKINSLDFSYKNFRGAQRPNLWRQGPKLLQEDRNWLRCQLRMPLSGPLCKVTLHVEIAISDVEVFYILLLVVEGLTIFLMLFQHSQFCSVPVGEARTPLHTHIYHKECFWNFWSSQLLGKLSGTFWWRLGHLTSATAGNFSAPYDILEKKGQWNSQYCDKE